MKKRITRETVLKRKPNQLFSNIDGEVVMLSIENGEYYSLDSIGSLIWNFFDEPRTFQNLICNLLNNYDVNEKTCVSDTQTLLEELLDKGLLEIDN